MGAEKSGSAEHFGKAKTLQEFPKKNIEDTMASNMEIGEKEEGNKSKNFTQWEEALLMTWAKGMGFGVNNNKGSLDIVIDWLASGTDEALNILASGQFNASNKFEDEKMMARPDLLRPFGEGGPRAL